LQVKLEKGSFPKEEFGGGSHNLKKKKGGGGEKKRRNSGGGKGPPAYWGGEIQGSLEKCGPLNRSSGKHNQQKERRIYRESQYKIEKKDYARSEP